MSQYLLSVHAGSGAVHQGPPPSPEDMRTMMQGIIDLEAELDTAGAFLFGGRLTDPDAATVVRSRDGDPVMTDGPYIESKEHIGGFYIIEAEDLDEALAWAAKVTEAVGAPIEVRPFQATGKAADHMGEMSGA